MINLIKVVRRRRVAGVGVIFLISDVNCRIGENFG